MDTAAQAKQERKRRSANRQRLLNTVIVLLFFVALGVIGVWQYRVTNGSRDISVIQDASNSIIDTWFHKGDE